MSTLFSPFTLRSVTLPNRVVVSPLCQYSAQDGMPTPWHFAHLSTFARGKAGLVFTEATAVEAVGRITPHCLGIWSDAHANALRPITDFIRDMGCVPGIQLAHAGRKGSTQAPFEGGRPLADDDPEAWTTVAPSAEPVGPGFPAPHELTRDEIAAVVTAFADAARRAMDAGFSVMEIHGAHGYLIHSFLSPLSNHRKDEYGGDLTGRMRFALEVTDAVRETVGADVPLFFRISAIDNPDSGWSMDESVMLANALHERGIDIVDCSSGGIAGAPRFRHTDDNKPLDRSSARAPGFQVPFAERIRRESKAGAMAVGVIVDPHQAEEIVATGKADLVALGREIMHNPFWPLHAAQALGEDDDYQMWPRQYAWAVDRRAQIQALNK